MAPLLFIMKKKTNYGHINNPCHYISLLSSITSKLGFVKFLETPFSNKTCVYYTQNMRISYIKIKTMARYVSVELLWLT